MISELSDLAIIATAADNRSRIGSGTLVADNMILTAAHVVCPSGVPRDHLHVRLLRDRDYSPANVVWVSESDLALIQIGGSAVKPAFDYRFCEIKRLQPVMDTKATGFPVGSDTPEGVPRDFTLIGTVRRESESVVSFAAGFADVPDEQTRFKGLSGAGVYARDFGRARTLFGVISLARPRFPNGKLYVASFTELEKDPSFRNALVSAGCPVPMFEKLEGSLGDHVREKYPFTGWLYQFAAGAEAPGESTHSFAIDVALNLNFKQVQAVVRGDDQELPRLSPRAVLPSAATGHQRNLIYLQAPGGYGKTSFLKRVTATAIDEGFVTFYLDVKSDAKDWSSLSEVFLRCAQGGGNIFYFERAVVDPSVKTVLIIDGLNESSVAWTDITRLLSNLADNHAGLSIMVADRMNPDRTSLPKGFIRAIPLPIDLENIPALRSIFSEQELKQQRLFRIPFFLDKLYKLANADEQVRNLTEFGRADVIGNYLLRYVGPPAAARGHSFDGMIEMLGQWAHLAYQQGSLDLPKDWGKRHLQEDLIREFQAVGLLVEAGDGHLGFAHQLIHDYLAARWLASNGRAVWTADNFDDVTLEGRSFDVLELASEIIGAEADVFVINVYDWNYRAAIECILNFDAGVGGKASPVSRELKDAIFAMRAEKMFDVFAHTRKSAKTRVQEFVSSFDIEYGELMTAEDLLEIVGTRYVPVEGGDLYKVWRQLFITAGPIGSDRWPLIVDSPLIGWTAASVFRRPGVLTAELERYLVGLYRSLWRSQPEDYASGVAVRWRIVHVMGAGDTDDSTRLLSDIVARAEDNEWVLYGAVRSLAEKAARAPDASAATGLLEPILKNVANLSEKVRREIRDVAILSEPAPAWWFRVYGEVLAAGLASVAGNPSAAEETAAWTDAIARFRETTQGRPDDRKG